MYQRCELLLSRLDIGSLAALEVSGNRFSKHGFKSYKSIEFPTFDICAGCLPETFDLIIAEQVFEHLLWPYRAAKNVYAMLNSRGYFLVSTPFLVPVHNFPVDCTRWTELGLKHFLAECGFPLEQVVTESWGNRKCVIANLSGWVPYRSRLHSLQNEPQYPYHVWALARKG